MIAGQRSQFNPHQSLADEQSRCGSLGEYKVGDEESDEHTFTVLQHGGDQQVLTNKHVPLPTLRSLLGEATGSVRQTEPEARRSSPATRTSSRAVNASRLTGASRAATGTSSSDDEATQQGGVVVATRYNAASRRAMHSGQSIDSSSDNSSVSDVPLHVSLGEENRPEVPREVVVIAPVPVTVKDAPAGFPTALPVRPSIDTEGTYQEMEIDAPTFGQPAAGTYSDQTPSTLPLEPGAKPTALQCEAEPWESKVNYGYYKRHPYFFFRLELTRLVQKLKPRPPRNFVDKLLRLMTDYGVGSAIDWGREDHYTQEYFIGFLRKLSGRETLPEVAQVALESGSYQTKDQYDSRNKHRDVASVIHWSPRNQLGALLTNNPFMSDLDNLVVNKEDPFGKFEPKPGDKLGDILTGSWYPHAYAEMVQRHLSRTDIQDKKRPFLCPVILGCDATGTDAYQRLKMEPIMMTLAIFNRSVRNLTDRSWQPASLLPAFDNKSKNARKRERQGDRLSRALKDGLNTRNYHRCAGVFLAALSEVQKTGMIVEMTIGGKKEMVHCYFPVVCFIGDIKNQDMYAGKVMSHARGMPRLFFQCHCHFDEMDNEEVECETFTAVQYHGLVRGCERITVYDHDSQKFYGGEATAEQREQFLDGYNADDQPFTPTSASEHPIMDLECFENYLAYLRSHGCLRVDSPMNDLDYGGTVGGQFTALSLDLLHSLLGGVVKRLVVTFLLGLPSKQKELFEEIADRIFLDQRSSEKKYLPRMNFTHGCVNLTEMTCREWVGLMLTVLVVCQSYSGKAVLEKLVQRTKAAGEKHAKKMAASTGKRRKIGHTDKNRSGSSEPTSVATDDSIISDDGSDIADIVRDHVAPDDDERADITAANFVQVAESMLALVGYVKEDEFWEVGDEGSKRWFKESCQILLAELKRSCPRYVGNGWKLAKVHAIFIRLDEQIELLGAPKNTDSEVFEGGLGGWVKVPAQNTNRQSHVAVAKRVALNLDEALLVDFAYENYTESTAGVSPTTMSNSPQLSGEGGRDSVCPDRKCEWMDPPADIGLIPPLSQNPNYHVGMFEVEDPTKKTPHNVSIQYRSVWQESKAIQHLTAPPLVERGLWSHYEDFFLQKGEWEQQQQDATGPRIIACWTEAFAPSGMRIRCHPNFGNKGGVFDYVLLRKDPMLGENASFYIYDQFHNAPVPECWSHVPKLIPEEDSECPAVSSSVLFGKQANHILQFDPDVVGQLRHEVEYVKMQHSALNKKVRTLAKWGRGKNHRFSRAEEEALERIESCPYDMRVSDLPLPNQEEYKTRWQKQFGTEVTPAKVLCIFKCPESGRIKALVHPCCHRTIENYFHSSVFVDKYTLQYRYLQAGHSVQNNLEDCMEPTLEVVDVENDVIDRIFMLEEFPSTTTTLNPSDWNDPPEKYGLKAGKRKMLVSEAIGENKTNRRRATEVRRSVMAVLPQEKWAKEFTLQFPK